MSWDRKKSKKREFAPFLYDVFPSILMNSLVAYVMSIFDYGNKRDVQIVIFSRIQFSLLLHPTSRDASWVEEEHIVH